MRRLVTLFLIVPLLMATAVPAAAQAPTTTEGLLSGMVTEEVEPGVIRILNDGLGPLDFPVDPEVPYDIVAGHDGGIYVLEPGHYTRLGSGPFRGTHKGFDWDTVGGFPSDVGVAPDGTVWAVFGDRLHSTLWGSGHETQHLPTMHGPEPLEVTSDGTVWAVWRERPGARGSGVFGYLDSDDWTMVGEWPFDGGFLRVSDSGEVWAVDHVGWGFFAVHRFVDGAWAEQEDSRLHGAFDRTDADVGADGTFWGIRDGHYGDPSGDDRLVRFDGTGWSNFGSPEWAGTGAAMRGLAADGDGWLPDDLDRSQWGAPHVAPDGTLWVPSRLGVLGRDPDLGGGQRNVCGYGIDGVARFDGETWSRFLAGRCVEARHRHRRLGLAPGERIGCPVPARPRLRHHPRGRGGGRVAGSAPWRRPLVRAAVVRRGHGPVPLAAVVDRQRVVRLGPTVVAGPAVVAVAPAAGVVGLVAALDVAGLHRQASRKRSRSTRVDDTPGREDSARADVRRGSWSEGETENGPRLPERLARDIHCKSEVARRR